MTEPSELRDRTAVIGIGEYPYSNSSGLDEHTMRLKAILAACEDAGISSSEIQGVHCQAAGAQDIHFINDLGCRDVRVTGSISMGGASPTAALQLAALSIASGICNYSLLFAGRNGSSGTRVSGGQITVGMGGGIGAEFEVPYGSNVPGQWYAQYARKHMLKYGTKYEHYGEIAINARANAARQTNAQVKQPISMEDYLDSPFFAEPHRRLDFCLQTDGACAVILRSAERAKNAKGRPVYLAGFASGYPDSPMSITQRPDMLEFGLAKAAPRAFQMAGITPEDVDVAEIYDCFTSTVLIQLETLGFCKKGEGGPFVEGGRIRSDGELPVNTHGGLHSQGHIMGLNHVVEAVKQCRGTSDVQAPNCEIALVTGYGDFCDGSIAIFRGE